MRIIVRREHVLSHGMATFDKESIGAAFGRAPQGRGAPLWLWLLFSLFSLVLLHILGSRALPRKKNAMEK